MPVTFKVASHDAVPVRLPSQKSSGIDILKSVLNSPSAVKEVLQTSLGPSNDGSYDMLFQDNGFVMAVVDAYNGHHHLVIRPDDVWIAILSQFNFYVNAHAEELRLSFVNHEGKKTLTVKAFGSRYTVDFGGLAKLMTNEIEKNVVDKELKDWILPNFSTTSHTDTVVCAALMMATLRKYFDYAICLLMCGIPSVTLEGLKSDWEQILSRIDKLESFGAEPTAWAAMLRPILRRFVGAFDNNPDVDFWSRACHYRAGGSGPSFYSGWITAFCVWTPKGIWLGPALSGPRSPAKLSLDGINYGSINTDMIHPSHCSVDIELDDNGKIFDCAIVSGHVGFQINGEKKDTLRPLPAWFMYIKGQEETHDGDE